ncbi:MAG TPA: ABC-F family ATP-binding cassette domain-containing protein [Solirubrobacteraceae bacterium]|nr:ABC-F family ATP-binding cassette domain-containing protein [Solirubrobacteraceae bacterium]
MGEPRNLVNLKDVEKGYGSRSVLRGVTLGVNAGARIGVVGENGGGKSTLLRLIAAAEQPDAGAVTRAGDVDVALLDQRDELAVTGASIGESSIGELLSVGRAGHELAADASFRDVLDGLLGGVGASRFANGLNTPLSALSGGERKRVALAQLLLKPAELLLLDEPTNHLDVEAVDWLARELAGRRGSMLIVTHDRWFLDAVCTHTWEVADGVVHQYDGGYAAYVLARAERDRQEQARESRRQQLIRKELAWLRRGPPARTTKSKFRVQAANELIADEPPARDRAELLRFASQRLGKKALEATDVSLTLGERPLLRELTWLLGGGDRVALVGVNGSGKTTLLRLLAGEIEPDAGTLERGATVKLGQLSQDAVELPEDLNVLESLQELRRRVTLSDGREITAGMLCERFGFRGERARAAVSELSGGERRRLALMRLLMSGPNVLLLDEPTNDLDVETLAALEDLLDGWPGTLVVVSHDRYFVERVCDDVYAIDDGALRHLPAGIEQYLAERVAVVSPPAGGESAGRQVGTETAALKPGAATRAARKDAQRAERLAKQLEREVERLSERELQLREEMAANPADYGRLAELQQELEQLATAREEQEASWFEATESIEG